MRSSVALATAPAHGTASVTGEVVTYVPAAGYYGADSFTYTVTGPGGTSAPATVALSVGLPPPPVARAGTSAVVGATTVGGSSIEIELSSLVDGSASSVRVETAPQHGTVELKTGNVISAQAVNVAGSQSARSLGPVIAIYTPQPGFQGEDQFSFVAIGPGGTSAPATITITVEGVAVVAEDKVATTGDGETVKVELTAGASGGPFVAAQVVSMTPDAAAKVEIVAGGVGANRTYTLHVTPAARFDGAVVIHYTLSNSFGTSAAATVTVNVNARPDPTSDPRLRAINDAQAESARRFARSQIGNFMQRNEALHNGGGRPGAKMGIRLQSGDVRRMFADPARRAESLDQAVRPEANAVEDRKAPAQAAVENDGGERQLGSIALWMGGAIEIGTQDRTTGRSKITATSNGLSAGADIKLADNLVIGAGGGWGVDDSDIDGGAAHVRGTSSIIAAYGSYAPMQGLFVDGMVATGDLHFRTRRKIADTEMYAYGSRDGSMKLGALALGLDRANGDFRWSAYGRAEWLSAKLDAYSEVGGGRMNLRFNARELESLSSVLGARFEYSRATGFGSIKPRLRAEWRHEFQDGGVQFLDYADIAGQAQYSLDATGWRRDQFALTLGSSLMLRSAWVFDLDLELRGAPGERSGALRGKITKEF